MKAEQAARGPIIFRAIAHESQSKVDSESQSGGSMQSGHGFALVIDKNKMVSFSGLILSYL